jgi:hypothetical protein
MSLGTANIDGMHTQGTSAQGPRQPNAKDDEMLISQNNIDRIKQVDESTEDNRQPETG